MSQASEAPHPREVRVVTKDSFSPRLHYYARVLNAHLHPLVRFFLTLGNARIAERYCHLHPEVSPEAITQILAQPTRHFRWGGADLFHITDERGNRQIVVIETNSCPSGQKSTPLLDEHQEQGGYRTLMERAFLPMLRKRGTPPGHLGVLYDKNEMEASGYAATLAELTGEEVLLVPCFDHGPRTMRLTEDRVIEAHLPSGDWVPIRGALRYVTQRPWNRLPPLTRTALFNPILCCLAGGRNKMLAAKAYDLYNARMNQTGLTIRTPETIWDVDRREIPLWIERMGGIAVVKVPYSNAGQGVYTIVNKAELDSFMAETHRYDRFIVQALIGNSRWSSRSRSGRLYHVGMVPNRRLEIFVADLRCMVGVSPDDGFFPVALYARRARKPLTKEFDAGVASSWEMLGTNLSVKKADGTFDTEEERLILMDQRDFNRLGLGLDDLVEAYIQTVLAVRAIDQMADELLTQKNQFRKKFFGSVNPDPSLVEEILNP